MLILFQQTTRVYFLSFINTDIRPLLDILPLKSYIQWWHHQMETFFALLVICLGISPVTGEFPAQSPVTRRFDVFFDMYLNKPLSKPPWGWWFETPSRPLWRQRNHLSDYWCRGDTRSQEISNGCIDLVLLVYFIFINRGVNQAWDWIYKVYSSS